MRAQIRFAKKGEFKGWIPPLVCVFGEDVRFIFMQGSHELIDVLQSEPYKPKTRFFGGSYIYQITETKSLCVTIEGGNWLFNGQRACEEWPTTHRRQFRCGDHVIDVKPEDDALSFLVTNDESDFMKAVIAFYLKVGTPSGD